MLIISRWSGHPQRSKGMDYCVLEVESAGKNSLREEILRIILEIVLKIIMGGALKEVEKKAKKKKRQLGSGSRVIIAVSIKEIK